MLVLSRGQGERVILDNGRIRVTILQCRGGNVRLGIEAPACVRVDREEIHQIRQARARSLARR